MQIIEKLFPGKFYHIYNRGNNRENIFIEQRNYNYFLEQWQKHVSLVSDTYAYCLMKNHFHFLVRIHDAMEISKLIETLNTPVRVHNPDRGENQIQNCDTVIINTDADAIIKRISKNFSNHFNAYSQAFNIAFNRTGKLFETPFERKPVNNEYYFKQLVYYIHSNPQKHGFTDDFRTWEHSSYNSLLSDKSTKLQRETVISWFNGREDFKQSHQLNNYNERNIKVLIENDD